MGANKVLLFVRSIDRAEREAIGIELKEDEERMASQKIGRKSDGYANG